MTPAHAPTAPLVLTKLHGAGNDFLVLVDLDGAAAVDARLASALCDRRTGVGADGVIRILSGTAGAPLTMELRNADGGVAEMSGNGIRCLALVAVEAGLVQPPTFTVATAAGVRVIEYEPGELPGRASASVDMGPVRMGDDEPPPPGVSRARRVDVGNPHLVLLGGHPSDVDVLGIGAGLDRDQPGGTNVEFIALSGPDTLDFRVWERGVGETLACGTGSVAAALAARSWGLVGDEVEVRNPGGTLTVSLGPPRNRVLADADAGLGCGIRLQGPVQRVATVEVDLAEFEGGSRS